MNVLFRREGGRVVSLRQIQSEGAAGSRLALQTDLTAKQPGQFSADRKPQTRASVAATRGAIRLLEGLKDDLLFVDRNADSGIGDRERHHCFGAVENRMARTPAGDRF